MDDVVVSAGGEEALYCSGGIQLISQGCGGRKARLQQGLAREKGESKHVNTTGGVPMRGTQGPLHPVGAHSEKRQRVVMSTVSSPVLCAILMDGQ